MLWEQIYIPNFKRCQRVSSEMQHYFILIIIILSIVMIKLLIVGTPKKESCAKLVWHPSGVTHFDCDPEYLHLSTICLKSTFFDQLGSHTDET